MMASNGHDQRWPLYLASPFHGLMPTTNSIYHISEFHPRRRRRLSSIVTHHFHDLRVSSIRSVSAPSAFQFQMGQYKWWDLEEFWQSSGIYISRTGSYPSAGALKGLSS
ncbi:hypothetical protein WAI453_006441 [Rhynchosporium graminicola]